jgi:hypothetical protein
MAPANSFTTNTAGTWQQNGITFVATESTLVFNIVVNTMLASGNDFGIDTITLDGELAAPNQTVVHNPEPGSWVLLSFGLGALALRGFRRAGRSRVELAFEPKAKGSDNGQFEPAPWSDTNN